MRDYPIFPLGYPPTYGAVSALIYREGVIHEKNLF